MEIKFNAEEANKIMIDYIAKSFTIDLAGKRVRATQDYNGFVVSIDDMPKKEETDDGDDGSESS